MMDLEPSLSTSSLICALFSSAAGCPDGPALDEAMPEIVEVGAYTIELQARQQHDMAVLDQALAVIMDRLDDDAGTRGITGTVNADGTLVLEIEAAMDVDMVVDLATATGAVDLYVVDADRTATGEIGPGYGIYGDRDGNEYVVVWEPLLPAGAFEDAYVQQQDHGPVITFRLTDEAGQIFADFTAEHIGEAIAVVLDGVVLMAPVVQSPITGGSGLITGNFSVSELETIATILRSGPLPDGMSLEFTAIR